MLQSCWTVGQGQGTIEGIICMCCSSRKTLGMNKTELKKAQKSYKIEGSPYIRKQFQNVRIVFGLHILAGY